MSTNRNRLPPSLVANLQQVLSSPTSGGEESTQSESKDEESSAPAVDSEDAGSEKKRVVLITNADGIDSPGLVSLVQGLASDGRFEVNVCAPQSDKSASGHSLTVRETVEVTSTEITGATASYEVSGTPADCVTLALSQALFSWSKPLLVISGINRGASSGLNMLYSGAIAGAREALIHGIPSLCISLNWKKDVSSENDFQDAVDVCLPLIHVVLRDVEKGDFPKSCLLNIEVPTSPSTSKGFKVTRQSLWRSGLSWQAVSSYKRPSALNFISSQQSLGIQLAQLGEDASAAGAARKVNTNRKNLEVESVGIAGKPIPEHAVQKYYRLESTYYGYDHVRAIQFLDRECDHGDDEDLDFRALDNGFVTLTPVALSLDLQSKGQSSVTNWLSLVISALTKYVGCYMVATDNKTSGQSEDDIIKKANMLFKSDTNVEFKFEHAWRVLRNEPKWRAQFQDESGGFFEKRARINEGGGYSSGSTAANAPEEPTPIVRPLGVKASKRKMKGKKVIDVEGSQRPHKDPHIAARLDKIYSIRQKEIEMKCLEYEMMQKNIARKMAKGKYKTLGSLISKLGPLTPEEEETKLRLMRELI